jgi:hypothetical protein
VHNFSCYVYFFSLHFSGEYVPVIRRNNCISAKTGTCYSVFWCAHSRQLSIQNNKYQASHENSCFSWWWAHNRPKHVEKRNKHTKKNCAPSWLYLQDYTEMNGQQNIKLRHNLVYFPGSFPWIRTNHIWRFFVFVPCIMYSLLSRTANAH